MNFVKLATYVVGFALPLQMVSVHGIAFAAKGDKGTHSLKNASTVLEAKSGNKTVKGKVDFIREKKGVRVIANVEGLKPNSKHGFHIHENGDCSAVDASSAGGHFNPTGQPHASPDADIHHIGDLGNLESDKSGKATINQLFEDLSLDKSNKAFIGSKALVIHAKADDLESQPSGDAGDRIACGVIKN